MKSNQILKKYEEYKNCYLWHVAVVNRVNVEKVFVLHVLKEVHGNKTKFTFTYKVKGERHRHSYNVDNWFEDEKEAVFHAIKILNEKLSRVPYCMRSLVPAFKTQIKELGERLELL